MREPMTLTETCSCGATITLEYGEYDKRWVSTQLIYFRKDHVHVGAWFMDLGEEE
jgi:hypothetical protein